MERDGEPLLRRQYLLEEVPAIDDVIADSAPNPLVYFSVFIAVCGPFAAGCAFSLFGSILTAGGLFGSLFAGKMSDLIGRKGAIGVSDALSLLGWIAIAISQSVTSSSTSSSSSGSTPRGMRSLAELYDISDFALLVTEPTSFIEVVAKKE
ncbi:hypothetical protein V2J09_001102 [Rumex salicifolius]